MGLATRQMLEQRGCKVIGVDRRDAEIILDLETRRARESLPDLVRKISGDTLDGVVSCAGVAGAPNSAAKVIRINYFSAVATLAGLRPLLAGGTKPRAAVISSVGLLRAADDGLTQLCLDGDEDRAIEAAGTGYGRPAYNSAKRAIAYWVRRAAPTPDWAGCHILLNAVAPGLVATPMMDYQLGVPGGETEALARVPQPLGIGKPEDVASLLVWLTGPENGLVTGQTIFVDGGHEAITGPYELPQHANNGAVRPDRLR